MKALRGLCPNKWVLDRDWETIVVDLDKYNESTEGFMSQQMGNRRRGQYEDGVLRVPLKSTSP